MCRFGLDVAALFPTLYRIGQQCESHPAFAKATPAAQVDAKI